MSKGETPKELSEVKVECQHDWQWQYNTREVDTYYHIHEVTDRVVCGLCGHIKSQSVYRVNDDHWMPFE